MIRSHKKFVSLFTSCIITKGVSQSVICDTERGNVHTIPNEMFDLVSLFKTYTIVELYQIYDDNELDMYLTFLHQNEYVFFTDEPELFPEISEEYSVPCHVHNSIICVSAATEPYLKSLIRELTDLCCQFLELRVYECSSPNILLELLKEISLSSIINVTIYYNARIDRKHSYLQDIIDSSKVIEYIYVYNSQETGNCKEQKRIFHTQADIDDKCCGTINPSFFSPNIATINLSKNYNSCLYRKISIDANGDIKHCPSMSENYGNVAITNLTAIVTNQDFQTLWGVRKDQILTCKTCEYRHICTDCRAYIQNPSDIYSKPLKCGYDPTTREWSAWSQINDNFSAIQHYNF